MSFTGMKLKKTSYSKLIIKFYQQNMVICNNARTECEKEH